MASMSSILYFLPMPKRILIVLFDGVQGLDVFGPAEVLAAADRLLDGRGYRLQFGSARGGPCRTSAGATVGTVALRNIRVRPADTVLVAGGEEASVAAAIADEPLLDWLGRATKVAGRIAAVCTGAFILGKLGLLAGKRCATHWSACDRLAAEFPASEVQRDAL
jgi:transcriptional regulator GlxA family with amidase domain